MKKLDFAIYEKKHELYHVEKMKKHWIITICVTIFFAVCLTLFERQLQAIPFLLSFCMLMVSTFWIVYPTIVIIYKKASGQIEKIVSYEKWSLLYTVIGSIFVFLPSLLIIFLI